MSGSESEKDWASSDGEEKEQPMATGLPRVTPEPQPGGRGMHRVMPKYMLEKAQKEPQLAAWTGADPWEGEDPFGEQPRTGESQGYGGKGREAAPGMENGKGGSYATWQTGCFLPL